MFRLQNYDKPASAEIACPTCGAKHRVDIDKDRQVLVFCFDRDDSPVYCETPFVVTFEAKNINETNLVGRTVRMEAHRIPTIEPRRRVYEQTTGLWLSLFPHQIEHAQTILNDILAQEVILRGITLRFDSPIARVSVVDLAANSDAYWSLGTAKALFFEYKQRAETSDAPEAEKSLVEQKIEAGETVKPIDFFTPPPSPEDFGGEDYPSDIPFDEKEKRPQIIHAKINSEATLLCGKTCERGLTFVSVDFFREYLQKDTAPTCKDCQEALKRGAADEDFPF